MAISLTDRKRLWGKAGNLCAICKNKLFSDDIISDSEVNIGEECHIISEQKNGPRHKSGLENYDEYNNLLLLCRNDHKIVDSLPEVWTEELLRYVKTNHELNIGEGIKKQFDSKQNETKPRFLSLITQGKQLIDLAEGVFASRIDYDVDDEKSVNEVIAALLQDSIDFGEILDHMSIMQKIEAGNTLQVYIDQLHGWGYNVYSERSNRKVRSVSGETMIWPVITIVVKRSV